MLKPATPLSILLFISFVLLLLSVISTPIIRSVPLASYSDYNFGVFGYCPTVGPCSGIKIGYTTDGLFSDDGADFNLPSSSRHKLSSLLIVHPVAALCNLIVLGLAVAAHFHSPSHSARYLLGLLILLLPTLLVTLLAFLVDILLFVPYVRWGGWIVLASTILITASGVVTCAMRRTLVSRKARKRRIAENAEMSGENFYNRQAQESKMAAVPTISTESKVPLVHGSPGADNLPAFATYDGAPRSSDRIRTNQPPRNDIVSPVSPLSEENRYYANPSRSNSRPPPGESGIPLGPVSTHGSNGPYRSPVEERAPGPYPPTAFGMRGGYGPPRGRGGPPPRGGFAPRGGMGPRGPPPHGYGRGGFSPDMRGGYGNRGRGGFPGGPMAAGAVGGMMAAGGPRNRGPPPPGYPPQEGNISPERYGPHPDFPSTALQDASPYARTNVNNYAPVSPSQYTTADDNTTTYVAYGQQAQSTTKAASFHSRGESPAGFRRSQSPPPEMPQIGQAVALDATNGRANSYDPEVQGLANLQRGHHQVESPQRELPQEYVPPRSQWNDSAIDDTVPTHNAVTIDNPAPNRRRGGSNASGSYYEDVDPRFAETADVVPALPQQDSHSHQQRSMMHSAYSGPDVNREVGQSRLPHTASYEDLPVGARSPAESETSHFTSVSQRGVNPNWAPGNGGEFNNFGPRRPQQTKHDMLLANNPDFELVPPSGRFGGRGGRDGFRSGPMGPGPSGRIPPPSAMGVSGDSPYPGPTTMREI